MPALAHDLSTPEWTAKLARRLEQAAGAVARLDARISASPVATIWSKRAAWTGFARALNAQGIEIDEIDIFSTASGVPLPHRRPLLGTTRDTLGDLDTWGARLAERQNRHWREELPFSFVPPDDWQYRPLLLRALELTARATRADRSMAPWLALPVLIQRLGISRSPLPCLVPADPALRHSPYDRRAIVARYLRAIVDLADNGLERLDHLEADRLRTIGALAAAHRPAALFPLTVMLAHMPAVTPTSVARRLRLTVSGAGKLLSRAAALGLVIEVTGRRAWQVYLVPDLAVTYGFVARPRGRPAAARLPEPMALDRLLAEFDAEVAAFDARVPTAGALAETDDLRAEEPVLRF